MPNISSLMLVRLVRTTAIKRRSRLSAASIVLAVASSVSGQAGAASYEYVAQPNLAQVHLAKDLHDSLKAYIASSTANTTTVAAVLDGSVDPNHVDLSGHISSVKVYSGQYTAYDNHATHVAGIVAGAQNGIGIAGVDPFASILNVPVFDSKGWVALDLGKRALDNARGGGARVVNMSYGPAAAGDVFLNGELNLFQGYNSNAPGAGMVLVRAAGNNGVNALNETFTGNASTALSNLLIVGSVNRSNTISSFSNRPGQACLGSCGTNSVNAMKNFFLVAPGENVLSDLPNNYIGYMSGTSMAAPHVTGAAALVIQTALAGNTQLAPGQVTQILKQSADDLGARGVDPVYGWGMLNVARALEPVGGTYVPTGSTVSTGLVAANGSGFGASSTMRSRSVNDALAGGILIDAFGRAFVNPAPERGAASAPSIYASNFLDDLSGEVFATTTEIHNDGHSRALVTSEGTIAHAGVRVMSFDNGAVRIESGLGGPVSYFSTIDSALAVAKRSYSYTMAQTFFSGAGDAGTSLHRAMFLGADYNLTRDLSVSSIYLRTTPATFDSVPDNISASLAQTQMASSLVKFGASYRVSDAVTAGVSYGMLHENGQTLGLAASGAYSLGNGTTHIAGANVTAEVGPSTTLQAFAERSTTESSDGRNSLLSSDEWSGSKFGISLTQSRLLGLPGNIRLSLVRPWQVDAGSLNVRVPVGRELDGAVDFQNSTVSVAAGETPIEIGLGYLWGNKTLKYGAEAKMLTRDIGSKSFSDYSIGGALRWTF